MKEKENTKGELKPNFITDWGQSSSSIRDYRPPVHGDQPLWGSTLHDETPNLFNNLTKVTQPYSLQQT